MKKASAVSTDLSKQVAFFAEHESEVRYYCRRVPSTLSTAKGAIIVDSRGREYVDMMSSCGSLNLGHNHPYLKQAAADYILRDGISAALDFHTEAKLRFMKAFQRRYFSHVA
ncbi:MULTISPECIES: aminotransferase class III-fold pyridoxal phosphate-dependent enzyme [Bradyrhizobium]|uniref:aminotransferase class III-fold pyridoxal phosphate-dependent enzyme n=1 Tax=Bradyrhizobium TaxID=374 RepID=UPI000489F2AC|nr:MULTISPECIES: aminotransferase class III-fold pyridoxal phosphate-dependent enzyme [Bradyrhizobium]